METVDHGMLLIARREIPKTREKIGHQIKLIFPKKFSGAIP